MSSIWRPPPHVRAVALGIVRRGGELLLMRVKDDDGNTKGWRPPGGGIELGELGAAAIARELEEELELDVSTTRFLGVLENIYEHHGSIGHELMMVYDVTLAHPTDRERFDFTDGGVEIEVRWRPLSIFQAGEEPLFPPALVGLLTP